MATSSAVSSKKRPFPTESDDQIYMSSPIHDRSSTFIAHFHPGDPSVAPSSASSSTLSDKPGPVSLTQSIKAVQSHPDLASADHRIVAWRRRSSQRTLSAKVTFTTGSDDDGEKYAGKRLEKVLIDLDVQGTVVVARWYGGVLLGPVRFTHMEMVAREAIKMYQRATHRTGGDGPDSEKRPKIAGDSAGAAGGVGNSLCDDADRVRLARQLVERDKSIIILRELLAEKTSLAAQTPAEAGGFNSQSPPQQGPLPTAPAASSSGTVSTAPTIKVIDYTEMPIQRLRQLDKARDATIAFILKQIDKAEENIKVASSPKLTTAMNEMATETATNSEMTSRPATQDKLEVKDSSKSESSTTTKDAN